MAEPRVGKAAPSPSPAAQVAAAVRFRPDRVQLGAAAGLVVLVAIGTFYFAGVLRLPLIDSLYFVCTTITTVGYGDITLRGAPAFAKLAGMALMFGGTAFMAVFFSLLTDWVITRRLSVLRGRVQVRGRGHVVLVGGGNVGFRVAGLLRLRGFRVVVIDRNSEGRHVDAMRATGYQVVLADATGDGVLELAGVRRAAAVLALTDSDATNLHVALRVRAICPDLPVVMRVFSPELAAHVAERKGARSLSPVAVAAERFAAAALAQAQHARS
jgi:hypothetical protein